MANANVPRGLIPVRHRNGAPYNGAANLYYVPSTYNVALFVGDPVIIVTDASDANGIQTVAIATAGATNYAIGSIIGMASHGPPNAVHTQDKPPYHAASTAGYVLVADDPDLVFECQEDGLVTPMGAGSVGRNIDLVAGSGSTVSGYSGWMLNSDTIGTGSTLQMRVVAPVQRADNDVTLAYSKWLVSFNLHSLMNANGV